MTTAVQITRAAVPAYQHITPAVPEMMALGIHAPIILDDQLIINDRLQPDRYIVTSISALRGGDVRDTRAVRPGDQGEVPYDSFWGGKTLTIDGTMEAGNIAELGRMETDLMSVLATLEEFPVKFNWWDQHDNFDDPSSAAFWGVLSGSPIYIPGNGRAFSQTGSTIHAYHNLRGGIVDCTVTAEIAVSPMGLLTNSMGVMAKVTADNSFIQALVMRASGTWSLQATAITPTASMSLGSINIPIPVSTTRMWIQLQVIGDNVMASVYASDPTQNIFAVPIASFTAALSGAYAQTLGYGMPGFCGLLAANTTSWAFLDWRVDALWPCDFVGFARAVSQPGFSHNTYKDKDRYKRDFQFAVRASDPHLLCPSYISAVVPLQAASAASSSFAFGAIFPRVFPLRFSTLVSQPSDQIFVQSESAVGAINLHHHGAAEARTVVVITGGITDPVFTNQATGESLVLDGTIAVGDYVIVDSLNHELTNSSGVDVFSMFDTAGEWPFLAPGNNPLVLTGSNPVGTPTATVYWRHTWM